MSARRPDDHGEEEPNPGKAIRSFFKRYYVDRKTRDGVTYAELGTETGIAPSTLTTILGKTETRPNAPSVRVIVRLARALCPPERELIEFAEEALATAGRPRIDRDSELLKETALERITRTGRVQYAIVQSEPFAYFDSRDKPRGFVYEVFQLLCELMDLTEDPCDRLTFEELPNALSSGDVDVVVSGVVPTFRRRQQMAFSRLFPYVSLPVSAIRHEESDVQTIDELLTSDSWTDRILLVRDELGDDFAKTLVRQVDSWDDEERKARIEPQKRLDPDKLADRLRAKDGPRVLIADLATCAQVLERGEGTLKALKAPDDDPVDRALKLPDVETDLGLRDLGEYGIAFALPRNEEAWLDHFNQAFDALLSEGLRVLLGIYAKWYARGLHHSFRVERGYGIGSARVRKAFKNLKTELQKKGTGHAK